MHYVAMTRAKDDLHLIVPQRFFTHGQHSQGDRHVYAARTRFIPTGCSACSRMTNLFANAELDEILWTSLSSENASPVLKTYVIQPAEFLEALDSGLDFNTGGQQILVADTGNPQTIKVTSIIADKENKIVWGFDQDKKPVVAYPATIGSADLPSPTGQHAVKNIVFDPEYSYRPDINFQQGENTKPLRIPPGPNGPVGSVWIGLDKPTYGIHGSPEPSKIDKANSHGCVRLTNWDAHELATLISRGVTVDFRE